MENIKKKKLSYGDLCNTHLLFGDNYNFRQQALLIYKHDTMEPICFKIGISLIINVRLKVKSEVMIN